MESSFSYIFTDDMIDMIVLRTSQEADREIAHRELGEELAERWFPLSKEEARAFFAWNAAGLAHGPSYKMRHHAVHNDDSNAVDEDHNDKPLSD